MNHLSKNQLDFWNNYGYLILPKFFSEEQTNQINFDHLWQSRYDPSNPLVLDAFIGTNHERRMYFKNTPSNARDLPYKLNDMFLIDQNTRNLSLHAELIEIINILLDGYPMVCNSLTFERGSQQPFHFDTFYMPAPVENKMLATWIALEDTDPDAGPLEYYPKSHKIPPYLFSNGKLNAIPNEMDQFQNYIKPHIEPLKRESFPARQGDVFIWHSQLFHGGSKIKNLKLTRKSLVTHYFRKQDFDPQHVESIGTNQFIWRRGHQPVS